MKKSLIGYSVKEVDELIDSLQNQNDTLVAKITNLTMQLAAAELKSGNTEQVDKLNNRIHELEEQADHHKKIAENKIRELTAVNSDLTLQIQDLKNTVQIDQTSTQKIGAICSRAYDDMEKMRYDITEDFLKQVNTYTNIVEENNTRMKESLGSVDEIYNSVVNTIAENLLDIFNKLAVIEAGREEIEKSILPVNELSENLKGKIKESVERSIHEQKQEQSDLLERYGSPAELTEPEPKEETPLDILKDFYLKRAKNKPTPDVPVLSTPPRKEERIVNPEADTLPGNSTKVIEIRANISADDVFKGNA